MKKTKITCAIFCTAFLLNSMILMSCQSAKVSGTIESKSFLAQNNTIENQQQSIQDSDTDPDDYDIVNNSKKNTKNKKFNISELFLSNQIAEIDVSKVFTAGVVGKIKLQDSILMIDMKNNMAGFGSPYLVAYYSVMFDQKNREKMIKLIDHYLNDFENKKLNRDNKKSAYAYGKIKGSIKWGTVKGNLAYGSDNAEISVGYEFVDKSPYFTLKILSRSDELHDFDGEHQPEMSVYLNYYFNKAQLKDLKEFLKEENIAQYLSDIGVDTAYGDDY